MKTWISILALAATLSAGAATSSTRLPGPLFDGMGTLTHPVTVKSPKAQRYFDQGLLLAYAFNHSEAIRSFRSAAALDPDCAMAWWGVALAAGPHVNKPMGPEDNIVAWEGLQKALALRDKASPRERAYIDALAHRYQAEFTEDRSALEKAYAEAMGKVVAQYPDDLDAQTLYAEALMNTMPWDYWTRDLVPKPETEKVFAALRLVLSRDPSHPGANHLYIHAVEAGPTPELALPSADHLRTFAPAAGHLVHMPSHIYLRVGQYHDAVVANERAVKADESFIRQTKEQGFYPGVYYPHNIHFLWYALMFEGRSAESLKAAKKAATFAADNYCGPNKAYEAPRLRHLPWITLTRFGRWQEVLKIPQPVGTNDFLVDRAMWHFARGLAHAGLNNIEAARAEHTELARLAASPEAKALDNPAFPASAVLGVADRWLAGRVAGAGGDWKKAAELLAEAVAAEDALPYMEPSFWPFPVRPALGVALLNAGEPAKAEAVFRADLAKFPRNGWGLLGLRESLARQDRRELAAVVERQFQEAWGRADTKLQLDWF